MKDINYNQQRQLIFESIKTLDLSYFQQSKNFHYEFNAQQIPLEQLEIQSDLKNYLTELKNNCLKIKDLECFSACVFVESFFSLIEKAKQDEIAYNQIRRDIKDLIHKIDFVKILKIISKNKEIQKPDNLLKHLFLFQTRKSKSAWISEKLMFRNVILKEFTSRSYGCLLPESSQDNGRYFSFVFFDKRAKWSQFTLVKIASWFEIEDYESVLAEAEDFIQKNPQHQTDLIIVSLGFSEEVFARFATGEKGNLDELNLKEVEFRANLEDAYENYANRLINNDEV